MAVEFKLPDLGEGIHEAEILDIRVKEGEKVKADQILFEVETDKAAVEVPSPYDGTVEKIFVKVGEIARVGNVMITINESGGTKEITQERAQPSEIPAPVGGREREHSAAPAAKHAAGGNGKTAVPAGGGSGKTAAPGSGPVPATPATRKLARELGVDLRLVPASGPAGRVTKEDVRAFAEGGARAGGGKPAGTVPGGGGSSRPAQTMGALSIAAKYGGGSGAGGGEGGALGGSPLTLQPVELPDFSKYGQVERVPLRSLRRKIAINMAQSWSHVPHVSNFDEADVTDLEATRQRHEKAVAERGGRLTLTAIALKAVVSGLKRFPQFNCSLDEATSELVFKHYYNIGVAVATEKGLIVPVIRDVDRKTLVELSIELAEVAQKTRDGKIELDRLGGGTFTITNIGPIGGTGMVPMVNYPEVAIMGMARSKDQPVVRKGEIVIRTIMPLALSFDHRVADGAEAAMFLRHIAACMEDPFQMLLEG
jgi:pyruvate dehydrogenase E2 component (dihydrolipoamide acetyltransferase)